MVEDAELLQKIAPGVNPHLNFGDKRNMLVKQHISTLYSLYPDTMKKLKQMNGDKTLGKALHQNIDSKAKKTDQAGKENKKIPQKKGMRVQKEGKRYLTTAISVDENGFITKIKFGGRGTSPYSNTMGAHTTAWTVLTDAFWSQLVGKTLHEAAEILLDIIFETETDLKEISSKFQADEKQIYRINQALGELGLSMEKLNMLVKMGGSMEVESQSSDEMQHDGFELDDDDLMELSQEEIIYEDITFYSPWEQMLILQEVINHVLNLQNLIPGASLYVGNVYGAREGTYRGILLDFLNQQDEGNITVKKDEIKKAVMGLLDLKGLKEHLGTTFLNLEYKKKYVHKEKEESSTKENNKGLPTNAFYRLMQISEPSYSPFEASAIKLLQHHMKMVEKAYPGAIEYSNLNQLSEEEKYKLSIEYSQDEGFEPDEEAEGKDF